MPFVPYDYKYDNTGVFVPSSTINSELVVIYEVMGSAENISENLTKKLSICTLSCVTMA